MIPFMLIFPLIVLLFLSGMIKSTYTELAAMIALGDMGIIFILLIVSRITTKRIFCDTMGWHKAPTSQGFDGCSANGTCPACGKSVMMDSQGNWF